MPIAVAVLVAFAALPGSARAQVQKEQQKLPQQDVVDVPTIGAACA